MTKFVLHGGNIGKSSEKDREKFFGEIVRDLKTPVRVLLVYFARASDQWKDMLLEDKANFALVKEEGNVLFEIASPDPVTFTSQLKQSDIMFVRGGDTRHLIEAMGLLKLSRGQLNGKVYVGASAGAYLVSRSYYSNDRKAIEDGLGILPIKCFAHWDESQQEQLEELKEYGEDLLLVKLPEGEFQILNNQFDA